MNEEAKHQKRNGNRAVASLILSLKHALLAHFSEGDTDPKRPTIAQVAGRALVLLLQGEAGCALDELTRHHQVDFPEGEPVLIDITPENRELEFCTDCRGYHDFGMCPLPDEPQRLVNEVSHGDCTRECCTNLEAARNEAADRNQRQFGTDPSWFGKR
jgi:hypothetical protein